MAAGERLLVHVQRRQPHLHADAQAGVPGRGGRAKPATYIGATPPTASPGPSGGRALRAQWKGCSTTGAGIAADFNAGMNLDGTLYTGPKVAYDIHSWTGVTFWAMATAGSDATCG